MNSSKQQLNLFWGIADTTYRRHAGNLFINRDDGSSTLTFKFYLNGYAKLGEMVLEYPYDITFNPYVVAPPPRTASPNSFENEEEMLPSLVTTAAAPATPIDWINTDNISDLPQPPFTLLTQFDNIKIKINNELISAYGWEESSPAFKNIWRNKQEKSEFQLHHLLQSGLELSNNEYYQIRKNVDVKNNLYESIHLSTRQTNVIWDNIFRPYQYALRNYPSLSATPLKFTTYNTVMLRHLHPIFANKITFPPRTIIEITIKNGAPLAGGVPLFYQLNDTKTATPYDAPATCDNWFGNGPTYITYMESYLIDFSNSAEDTDYVWPCQDYAKIEHNGNLRDFTIPFSMSTSKGNTQTHILDFLLEKKLIMPDKLILFAEPTPPKLSGNPYMCFTYGPSNKWDTYPFVESTAGKNFIQFMNAPGCMQIEKIELFNSNNSDKPYRVIEPKQSGTNEYLTFEEDLTGLHSGNAVIINLSQGFDGLPNTFDPLAYLKIRVTSSRRYTYLQSDDKQTNEYIYPTTIPYNTREYTSQIPVNLALYGEYTNMLKLGFGGGQPNQARYPIY